ncbi:SMP-30/gluconolactonase/LRE family protein [Shewanella algae]|uniref:SMP-30/gluconolactonase/LRE family protein n=1 Tax=Shewanella algae TaxID=38313 RepID=UPI001681E1B4|nr:SMP-30/gluconolactonase/LRE family protein [Shewanella algae]MBO2577388.1 SMP-30/gluconolactonase/LRE family protein [Shewanella algae]MBO2682953.1 SMP-30/gluconolactonase/LRE family protein [Shewanella algae]MBO2695754.1 SMP-30/gluconolactonase/LRE family protein [Shewanella algae]QNV04945.1 hypothetical protein EIY89_07255 [Shewanella algae]QQO83082.1 hypothetical protein D7032_07330 [Shewanella algae]
MINVIDSNRNILGEGLYIYEEKIYWVDITNKKLFISDLKNTCEYNLPEQAGTVLDVLGNKIFLASESGICVFDISSFSWLVKCNIPSNLRSFDERANDGVKVGENKYLFGTMKKENQKLNGALWVTNGNDSIKIHENIGIPNSFIKLSDYTYLISDSLLKLIYKFEFEPSFLKVKSQEIWLDLSSESCTPDGGCIHDGFIYFAMWDGSCINKYDLLGRLISKIKLPIKRPTNCKLYNYDSLIVTSAKEESVESGKLFHIELQTLCQN